MFMTKQEDEATNILQRIRAGTDIDTIVKTIQEGDLLLQLSVRPEFRYSYEFPYNRDMPVYLENSAWTNPYFGSTLYKQTHGAASTKRAPDETLRAAESNEDHRMYQAPYHAVELLDTSLVSLDLTKWTAVPASNSLLRSLLEICK